MGVGWVQFFLAESQSRLYPYMHAKYGLDPTAGSKKVPFNFISRYSLPYTFRTFFKINFIVTLSQVSVKSCIRPTARLQILGIHTIARANHTSE